MKSIHILILGLALSLFACKPEVGPAPLSPAEVEAQRGTLIRQERIASYSTQEIKAIIDREAPPLFADQIDPQFGVVLYKLVYQSQAPDGTQIQASGLFILPQGAGDRLPWISYQHGTLIRKSDAPSQGVAEAGEAIIGVALGGDGFACSLPDYLGLGESPGLHPYVHAASEATAAIDMMRASRSLASDKDIALDKELFLVGYSQGGHATMALHKELEAHYTTEFAVTASSPMAGPYGLSNVMTAVFLEEKPYGAPFYLPYLLFSYNQVYELFPSPSDFLRPPYDKTLPALFDGIQSGGKINNSLPEVPRQILNADMLEAFIRDQQHPLRLALADNDLYDWEPQAPIRLYHCEADELVPYENSTLALQQLQTNGSEVSLVTPDNVDFLSFNHGDCALPSLIGAREWFLSLVK